MPRHSASLNSLLASATDVLPSGVSCPIFPHDSSVSCLERLKQIPHSRVLIVTRAMRGTADDARLTGDFSSDDIEWLYQYAEYEGARDTARWHRRAFVRAARYAAHP